MGAALKRFIAGGPAYWVTIAALLAVAVGSVVWFRHEFSILYSQVTGAEDHELKHWRAWAEHYDRLFAMLAWNAPLGVQIEELDTSTGIVITRHEHGLTVARSVFLADQDPGVILTMDARTAEDLLATVPETEPDEIWQMMKDRLNARRISIWNDPDIDRLHRQGYLAFMRALDTRPAGSEWPEIHELLNTTNDPPAP